MLKNFFLFNKYISFLLHNNFMLYNNLVFCFNKFFLITPFFIKHYNIVNNNNSSFFFKMNNSFKNRLFYLSITSHTSLDVLKYSVFEVERRQFKFYNVFDDKVWLLNIKNILNLIYSVVLNKQCVFIIPNNIFYYQTTSFIKYVFGIFIYEKYSFLRDINNINWKSFKWQNKLRSFFFKFNIKVTVFVEGGDNAYNVSVINDLGVITIGVVSRNIEVPYFNYWVLADKLNYFFKYLFFSLIYSAYSYSFNELRFKFFKNYNLIFNRHLFFKRFLGIN